ncbi:MAG TPA: prepilin-type N-terminal cleavage/methylation domain-containing protein [bacterium]|nr:prepilin-type N-terminal cleavage/methylation domain-containing protein [bacterium]
MKRPNGFTIIEVLFSILIFSIGIVTYMQYQGQAAAVIFETESSIIANQLAVDLAEEINSLSEESFSLLIATIDQSTNPTAWKADNILKAYAGTTMAFSTGPYNAWGKPLENINEPATFYRMIRKRTYNELTAANNEPDTPLEVLRVIEIIVAWPKKESQSTLCNIMPLNNNCNSLTVVVVKPLV